MPWVIALLNSVAAVASVGFGVAAVIRPQLLAPDGHEAVAGRYFPAMYAGRAVPLGLAVGIVVWLAPTLLSVLLLGVATIAQLADIAIGALYRVWGMAAGAAFATVCHAAAIVTLL